MAFDAGKTGYRCVRAPAARATLTTSANGLPRKQPANVVRPAVWRTARRMVAARHHHGPGHRGAYHLGQRVRVQHPNLPLLLPRDAIITAAGCLPAMRNSPLAYGWPGATPT